MSTNSFVLRRSPSKRPGIVLALALAGWLLFAEVHKAASQSAAPAEVSARSDDRAAAPLPGLETIPVLVGQGMLDQAEALARKHLDAAVLSSDEAAQGAVALASVRVTKLLRAPLDQQPVHLEAAREPLLRVLRAYPDHRRAAWLRFQQAAIDVAVAKRQAVVLTVTPGADRQRLEVLAVLIERGRDLQALEQEVAEQIAIAFEQRDRSAWIDELMALRNAIAVKRVETLLQRGELFAAGSDDALAAAAEAQQTAITAMSLVRGDPVRQAELVRMRCEALLRMGQVEQAVDVLQPLLAAAADSTADSQQPALAGKLNDPTLALAVRLAVEQNQIPLAERLLASHYGDHPTEAAAAPESDLARLRFLIAQSRGSTNDQQHQQAIGAWMEAIRQRGGDFAQRRAETIVVELLGQSLADSTDPRIVLAKAAADLRAGNAMQAAEQLRSAAHGTTDPIVAKQLAIAGAAALSRAGQQSAAAELLREISLAHQQTPEMAELHLQAAVLLDQLTRAAATDPAAVSSETETVDQLLRQTLQLWPGDPAAEQARSWLVARLLANGKPVEAAIAASPHDFSTATDQQWGTAASLWIQALAAIPLVNSDLTVDPAVERLALQALAHFPAQVPAAAAGRQRLIALFGGGEFIAAMSPSAIEENFVRWLVAVRRGEAAGVLPIAGIAPLIRQAAAARLIADGIATPSRRGALGAAIEQLAGDEPTLERAVALLWTDRWQDADVVLDRWVQDRGIADRPAATMTAALVLRHAPHRDAKHRALARLTAASAQLPLGSDAWHQSKLATLEVLSELDQQAEAVRLARYILLTRPPKDPAVQARYQSWSEP